MEVFECKERYKLYISDYLESTSKQFQANKHNLQILVAEVKDHRQLLIRNESERQKKKSFERCQLESDLKLIQNKIEKLRTQINCDVQESTKCKQEINNINIQLTHTDHDIKQASQRCTALQNSKEEMEDELKNKWNALIKACNYYKQNLKCYIQIDDPQVMSCYFYFFTVVKTDKCYVKLMYKDGKWSFSELTPTLPNQAAMAELLALTNDVQGFLWCVMKLQEHSLQHPLKGQ